MPSERLLLIPALLAVLAVTTDWLPAKMGVPIACAVLLLLCLRQGYAASETRSRHNLFYVVAALLCSAAGDYFLSSMAANKHFFVIGIGLYLLAHLGYLGFALKSGRLSKTVLALLLLVYLPYCLLILLPVIADEVLFFAVLAYLLISCTVFATAWGSRLEQPVRGLFILGIGLIVTSDTIISFTEFLHFRQLNWLILPTYYLAHLSITYALMMYLRRSAASEVDVL